MHINQLPQLVVGGDREVPLLDGRTRRYINLDNAASTPVLQPILDGVLHFMPWYSSIHRGAGFKSQLSTWAYEKTRDLMAKFLGAEPSERVVIYGKNTTEAINLLCRRFPFRDGDVLLTTQMEHHSNDLPWRRRVRIARLPVDDNGAVPLELFATALQQHHGRVRLVAVTGSANVTGILNPIYDIARLAHENGAEIFVDAAQLAPHRAIRMGSRGQPDCIDYLALSAHKMYAPFGTGVLIGWHETFENGDPDYVGGGTVLIVTENEVVWDHSPDRDEAGSPNVVGAVALGLATRLLARVSMQEITNHETQLTTRLLDGMKKIPGVIIYGLPTVDPQKRLGVMVFNLKGEHHAKVAAILGFEAGIAVRNGCFCAQPYLTRLLGFSQDQIAAAAKRIKAGDRGNLPGMVRVSLGCYNTLEEVNAFLETMEMIAQGEYKGVYELDAQRGEYWPKGFKPDYADFFAFA
jgi:selenocysteine lyase/cysteine desulfurase